MKILSSAILGLALAALAPAQIVPPPLQFDLPTQPFIASSNNFPFGGPLMRYQQWFSAAEWQAAAVNPVRVTGVQFKAGNPGGQPGKEVTIDVKMANTSFFVPTFDNNLGVEKAMPAHFSGTVLMGTATPGTFPLAVVFNREFVWDGVSGVTVEVKVFNNGNFGQAYPFDLEATFTSFGKVSRGFNTTSPTAASASVFSSGQGLSMRFDFVDGITHPFSSGCPGGGGIVPTATTSNGPPMVPNQAWEQVLTDAAPNAPAVFALGRSRSVWGEAVLPLGLDFIGANGCFLLVEPMWLRSAVTSQGFGFGDGVATIAFPIMPDITLRGQAFFSQWLVLDAFADNGLMSTSQGLIHVVNSF